MTTQSELTVQLIKALTPKMRTKLGRLSWVAMIDEINDSTATGRLLINASEDFRVGATLNHQIAQQIGHLVLRDLPQHNYAITATGMAQLNEEIGLTLERSNDGIWEIVSENSTITSGTRYDSYAVAPKELSIGPSSYRELLTNYHLVDSHVKKGIRDYLDAKINVIGVKFKEQSLFVSPADKTTLNELISIMESMSDATRALLDVTNRLRGIPFIKKASDDEDGIDVSAVMGLVTNPFEGIVETYRKAQVKMNRMRSSDFREAVGLTANAYYKDIKDCMINIEGQIQSYNETFVFTKKNEGEEYKTKFLDSLNKNCVNIIEKTQSLQDQYKALSN